MRGDPAAAPPAAIPAKPEAAARPLELTVTDLDNPAKVGGGVRYVIRVTNQGTEPQNEVVVAAQDSRRHGRR